MSVNCRNSDGISPLLLVTRDVDLFDRLQDQLDDNTFVYSPVTVARELLALNGSVLSVLSTACWHVLRWIFSQKFPTRILPRLFSDFIAISLRGFVALLGRIEYMRCGLLRLIIRASVSLAVCQGMGCARTAERMDALFGLETPGNGEGVQCGSCQITLAICFCLYICSCSYAFCELDVKYFEW